MDGHADWPIHVIASAAKQSILPRQEQRWIASSQALLAMTRFDSGFNLKQQMHVCHLAARPARGLRFVVPRRKRGSKECRMRAAPAVSRAKGENEKRTRAYRSAENIRHSLRNGFAAYNALSPATNSFCHRHRRIDGVSAPGWADTPSPI